MANRIERMEVVIHKSGVDRPKSPDDISTQTEVEQFANRLSTLVVNDSGQSDFWGMLSPLMIVLAQQSMYYTLTYTH